MSIYHRAGAALLRCLICSHEELVHWEAGDGPIYIEEHCGEVMRQVTHNDGTTPLSDPCPSYCCPPNHPGDQR